MTTTFSVLPNTTKMIEVLRAITIDEVVTFATLSKKMKADIKSTSSVLISAMRILQRDSQYVFESVRGVGYRRLDDTSKVQSGGKYVGKMHRAARRGKDILATVDYDELSSEDQKKHNLAYGTMGAIALMTAPSGQKKLAAAFESVRPAVPIESTLALFGHGAKSG